jgi:hypothetical protein
MLLECGMTYRASELTLLFASLAASLALSACAEVQENVKLQPSAQQVEFAQDPPSPNVYRLVGTLTGEAAGPTPDSARVSATNDLRNKAAALGATFVTVDEDEAEMLPLQDKAKSVVTGRAYALIE